MAGRGSTIVEVLFVNPRSIKTLVSIYPTHTFFSSSLLVHLYTLLFFTKSFELLWVLYYHRVTESNRTILFLSYLSTEGDVLNKECQTLGPFRF